MGLFDFLRGRRPVPPAQQTALDPQVFAAYEATRRSFVRVSYDTNALQLRPTVSKVGGIPYVPADEMVQPEHYIFVAQLNFAEVPPIEGLQLPRTGLVQFWVPDDDTFGIYTGNGDLRGDNHRCIVSAV